MLRWKEVQNLLDGEGGVAKQYDPIWVKQKYYVYMYINAQKICQMSKENKFSLISENESRGREIDFSLFPLLYSLIFFSNKKLFYKFKNEFIVSIFTSQYLMS